MAAAVPPEDRDEMAIPSYLHRNPAMRWMAWRRVELLARRLRAAARERADGFAAVLDYGCGTGVLFEEASRVAERVYGVDLVLEPARLLVGERGLDRVALLTPDEAERAIAPASLDVVLAAEVLEHIDPIDDTLAFFRSRLRAGGRLLASLPTESLLYRAGRRLAGFRGGYHHDRAASIDRKVVAAGFRRARLAKTPGPGPLAIYWILDYRSA